MPSSPTANGTPSANATQLLIQNLDQISNEQLNLSTVFAIDEPSQTFKVSLLQLKDFLFGSLHSVGDIILTLTAENPAVKYGGTWELLPVGGSLSTGDGLAQAGAVIGDDDQLVPVPEHDHANTATASSAFTGSALPTHLHGGAVVLGNAGSTSGSATRAQGSTTNTSATSAGTPSGSVSTTVTMANALAGTAGATIDVSGAELIINAWKKTA